MLQEESELGMCAKNMTIREDGRAACPLGKGINFGLT